MKKYEQELLSEKATNATIRHEVHEDHVVIIIDGGQENQFRCRIDRNNADASVFKFTNNLMEWQSKLDSHLAESDAEMLT